MDYGCTIVVFDLVYPHHGSLLLFYAFDLLYIGLSELHWPYILDPTSRYGEYLLDFVIVL